MEHDPYLAHVARDGDLLAAAVDGKDLTVAVAACPGWTVKDLVVHVAEVYEHKIQGMLVGVRPDPWPPEWPAERDPVEWFRDAHARLLAELRSRSPEEPTWTWFPADQTVAFWGRRMAQETAVHRVDAEAAFGAAAPIDADLALDGIDEVLFVVIIGDWADDPEPPDRDFHLNVRSGGETFHVTVSPAEVTATRSPSGDEEPAADATISGEPSAVLLWLWNRADGGEVEVEGDDEAVAQFRRRLAIATE